MTYLRFKAGGDWYAIAAQAVTAVVPAAPLRACPGAPDWVAGLLPYQGGAVPVADLTRRLTGTASRSRLSTRILLVAHPRPGGGSVLFGLMAEGVTDTIECAPSSFSVPAPGTASAPWLGPLAPLNDGLVQLIRPERVLSAELEAVLFG